MPQAAATANGPDGGLCDHSPDQEPHRPDPLPSLHLSPSLTVRSASKRSSPQPSLLRRALQGIIVIGRHVAGASWSLSSAIAAWPVRLQRTFVITKRWFPNSGMELSAGFGAPKAYVEHAYSYAKTENVHARTPRRKWHEREPSKQGELPHDEIRSGTRIPHAF